MKKSHLFSADFTKDPVEKIPSNPLPDNGIAHSVKESSEHKNRIKSLSDSATGKLLPGEPKK